MNGVKKYNSARINDLYQNPRDDFKPGHFLDPAIDGNYPQQDYHRFFFGEIVLISGADKYYRKAGKE